MTFGFRVVSLMIAILICGEVELTFGRTCVVCVSRPPTGDCANGTKAPEECKAGVAGTDGYCHTLVVTNINDAVHPDTIVGIIRSCEYLRPEEAKDSCSISESQVYRSKNCDCSTSNCNNKPLSYYEDASDCVMEDGSLQQCSMPKESCETKIFYNDFNGPHVIKRDCSHKHKDEGFCEKVINENGLGAYISCHCNGRGCNEKEIKDQNSIIKKNHYTKFMCVQCDYAKDGESCSNGQIQATLCTDAATTNCITEVEIENNQIVQLSRACEATPEADRDKCVTSTKNGKETTTCGCLLDGCNSHAKPMRNIKNLSCLNCKHSEIDKKKVNLDCKQGKTTNHITSDSACFYKEIRDPSSGSLVSIERSHDNVLPTTIVGMSDNCEQKGAVRTCYCFTTFCNRNTPDGIKCLHCDHNHKECEDGTFSAPTTCRNDKMNWYNGATGASCVETKHTEHDSGKVLGYSRGCAPYRETEAETCEATKSSTSSSSEDTTDCFCNTGGCVVKVGKPKEITTTTTNNPNSSHRNNGKLLSCFVFLAWILLSVPHYMEEYL